MPQKSNFGNLAGDCTHILAECLVNPRHRKILDSLVAASSCKDVPVVDRYITKYCKKANLPESSREKIERFLLILIKDDFLCEKNGGRLIGSEIAFDITSDDPEYRLVGYIDQIAEYPGDWIRIKDFKTQAREFEGEERDNNTQAYFYTLAAKQLYGQHKKVVVDFLMLNFPKAPIFRVYLTDRQLEAYKKQLGKKYIEIRDFGPADRFKNVAKNQPFPQKGEGFVGCIQCGWAGAKKGFVKSPDQLKADGVTPAFACAFRFGFDYYALCGEDDKVIITSFENNLAPDESKGQYVINKKFLGCEAFRK